MSLNVSDAQAQPAETGVSKSCCDGPNRYYIAFAVVAVIALALGLGLGLGLKKSTVRVGLDVPLIQPPVAASVPSSLRPTNAGWNKPQQDVGSVSGRSLLMALPRLQAATGNQSLAKIKDRLFGPGPADFVTRLGMIDQRMQEFKTRNAEGAGRVCVGEAAKQWTPNFLPSGVSFPMWFSCQEVMAGGSGLTVLFGKQGTTTYVGELQWPPANMNAPRMAVLAAVSNNGTQVEAWQIVTGTNMVSYLQIRADRTSQEVVLSFASTEGNQVDIGCGVRLRSTPTLTWFVGDINDPAQAGTTPCSGNPTNSVCADTASLTFQSASMCTSIQSFSTSNITTSVLTTQNLISLSATGIQTPNLPVLTSFAVAVAK